MDKSDSFDVRVIVLGQSVQHINCPAGASLEAVLDGAAVATAGKDVRVNGHPADPETTLASGDVVTIIPRVRGGSA